MPSYGPRISAEEAYRQCSREGRGSGWFKWISQCGYPGAIGCASLEAETCILRQQVSDERQQCNNRLNEFRAQAAEERRRLAAEQRAADEFARQHERQARQAVDMSRELLERGDPVGANRILEQYAAQNDPTQLPRDFLALRDNIGEILRVEPRPVDRLAREFTDISLDQFGNITGNAMDLFGAALGGGALEIDPDVGGSQGAGMILPGGGAFPGGDPGAGLIQSPNAYADIIANFNELSTVGQVASILSIIGTMVLIAESDGRPIPPSLVDGTFAANVTALAEAAAGGTFRFTDEVDVYTARAEIVETEIAHERRVADARQLVAADRARREVEAAAREAEEAAARAAEAAARAAADVAAKAAVEAAKRVTAEKIVACITVTFGGRPTGRHFFGREYWDTYDAAGLTFRNTCQETVQYEFAISRDPEASTGFIFDPITYTILFARPGTECRVTNLGPICETFWIANWDSWGHDLSNSINVGVGENGLSCDVM